MTIEEGKKLLEEGFTPDQVEEIEEGLKAGLDTAVYARKEFYALQMREIRKGLEKKLPVQIYAKTEYDWFQMEEIRKGLKAGLNVSLYAFPTVSYEKMRQIRKGLKAGIHLEPYIRLDAGILRELRKAFISGINIVEYIKQGYDTEQLQEIRHALLKGVDLKPYLLREFRGVAIAEICEGLEKGLDVSSYARIEYSWQQMREIRLGLENRVDTGIYASPLYDWQQMREIRLGLESGIDISSYRSQMHTANEMRQKRLQIQEKFQKISALKESMHQNEADLFSAEIISPETAPEDHGVVVIISRDEMEACVRISSFKDRPQKEGILKALEQEGVTRGVDEAAIDGIVDGSCKDRTVIVARGMLPQDGSDGWYEFFFKTEPNKAPQVLEDGSVDYQNIEWFEMVEQGQKLAYYHDAGAGISGFTVTGKVLPSKKGKEQSILSGRGFMLMPDRRTYLSTMNGKIELHGSRMEISSFLVLDEMTIATGNVNFDGCVHVKGNIGSGTVIRATEDVLVDGFVESAMIEAGGNIVLRQGVNASGSGYIKSDKSVLGKFFEAVRVHAKEDIRANYCLNCELYAQGKIVISGVKGTLAGGTTYAAKEVQSYQVGNQAGIATYIKLGLNEDILNRQRRIEEKIKSVNKELSILGNAYLDFQRKYPPEVRNMMDMYLKIESAIYTKEKEMEKLYSAKEQVEENVRKTGEASVKIRGTLFEGVLLEIDGLRWAARNMKNATIKRVDNRIAAFSN